MLFWLQVQDNFDRVDFNRMCWTLCARKNLNRNHLLISDDDAFKIWCIFNFLSEDRYPLIMVAEEVSMLSGETPQRAQVFRKACPQCLRKLTHCQPSHIIKITVLCELWIVLLSFCVPTISWSEYLTKSLDLGLRRVESWASKMKAQGPCKTTQSSFPTCLTKRKCPASCCIRDRKDLLRGNNEQGKFATFINWT